MASQNTFSAQEQLMQLSWLVR